MTRCKNEDWPYSHMENNMESPKIEYIPKENEISLSKRYPHLHAHVYCSTVDNGQDMELIKLPIDK
jgi:hypothetical protein